ncbi:Ubiquinol-cytochrome c reductase complex 17 kd protein [Rasamsonia emersonii CBS 393.64]|uniref:Ubiquinol-cytochrome c reductase complex 17 kd protein n=1 Tax=Rasamsonia emersonii (strain ATCC 16479 / CBS 393.64 / IMI 116815) TaxID=1408163 RepID=A0A0F4YV59_RASE3|nr:Ubiquinol-cytochrome c reductase complex 17 kd protein [Rasamsonia emersonii CBS 393.64]KKA21721.1 Ubiquinol-cytochrome c reductase complex 17 kd protein [Rasamsonia emersonii CBS 393.64]
MGLSELFSEMISSLGFAEAQAEAPPAEDTDSGSAEPEQEEKTASEEAGSEEGDSEGASEEPEQEEEEEEPEEEEQEAVDPKPKLEQECANSAQCAPVKHHFDECVERVTRQQEDPDYKGPKEDCVEECKLANT